VTTGVRAATPILTVVTIAVSIIALGLVGGGLMLVSMRGIGDTEMQLLGSSFKSQNVGAVGIFSGLLLGLFCFRRIVKSIERIGNDNRNNVGK